MKIHLSQRKMPGDIITCAYGNDMLMKLPIRPWPAHKKWVFAYLATCVANIIILLISLAKASVKFNTKLQGFFC